MACTSQEEAQGLRGERNSFLVISYASHISKALMQTSQVSSDHKCSNKIFHHIIQQTSKGFPFWSGSELPRWDCYGQPFPLSSPSLINSISNAYIYLWRLHPSFYTLEAE